MSDSVVSIHSASGTLAKQVIQQAPEGMLIAPVWKRIAAFMLDTLLITIVLSFITQLRGGQPITAVLLQFSYFSEGPRYIAFYLMNWVIFLFHFGSISNTLVGLILAVMGRELSGLLLFTIRNCTEQHHWGNRAFDKLKYLIPIIGWLIFGLRDAYKAQSKDAEYRTSVDIKNTQSLRLLVTS